jgi:hypothetical protein
LRWARQPIYFAEINLLISAHIEKRVKRSPTKSHYLVVANAVFAELYERRGHWPDRESGQ